MIPLDDTRWQSLNRPCFLICDIAQRLRDLETASDLFSVTSAWDNLGSAVCHQNDVSIGSYAAVPHMVRICDSEPKKLDYNLFLWVAAIEEARLNVGRNPPLPSDFETSYFNALGTMHKFVYQLSADPWGPSLAQCIMSWQMLVKGHVEAAACIHELPWRAGQE